MSDNLPDRQPCSTCPWRVGVDAWAIGRDHHHEIPPLHRSEMWRMAEEQDGRFGAQVMACHLTFKGEEEIPPHHRTCVGFALSREGGDNLSLRVLAFHGKVDLRRFSCAEPLHPDFLSMLAANPARPASALRKEGER